MPIDQVVDMFPCSHLQPMGNPFHGHDHCSRNRNVIGQIKAVGHVSKASKNIPKADKGGELCRSFVQLGLF
jgi:hypothetical protein